MRQVLYMLGQLSDDNIEWMIAHGERRRAARGTVLIKEGVQSDDVLIVLDGTLGVYIQDEGGGQKLIAQRISGEILGDMSFIDDRLPSATVKAEDDALLFTIPKATLAEHLEDDRDFAARFYRGIAISLSYRMRDLMGQGDDDEELDDELDTNVLDSVYLAGLRFERILKRMMG